MTKAELLKALKNNRNYYPDQDDLTASEYQMIADYVNNKTHGRFTADEVKAGLDNYKTCQTRKDWEITLSCITDDRIFTDLSYDLFASGRTYKLAGHNVKVKLFDKPTMIHVYDDGSKSYLVRTTLWIWVDGIFAKVTHLDDNFCFDIDCPELNFFERSCVYELYEIYLLETMNKPETITETATQNDTAETADNAHETVCPTIEICEAICTDEKPQTPQEQFKDLCKRFKAGYSDTAELKPTEEYKSTATDDRGRAKEYMEICNRIGIEKRLMAKFEKEKNPEGVNGCKERILNLHRVEGYVKHHSDWKQENFRIERGQKNLENIEFARRLFADYWKVEMDIDAIPLFVGDSTDFVNALTGQYFVNIMRDKPTDLIAVVINLVAQSKNGPLLTEEKLLHKFNRWLNYMSTSPNFNPNLDKWETTDDILWDFIDKRRNFYENSEDRYPTNEEIFGLMTKEEN